MKHQPKHHPATASFKLIVLGAAAVGKTNLVSQFTAKSFSEGTPASVGLEFSHREQKLHDTQVRLNVWDTAGQERFRSLTQQLYRGAAGVLLVYDVTDINSFHELPRWVSELHKNRSDQEAYVVAIVGNKYDLYTAQKQQQRLVTESMVRELVTKTGLTSTFVLWTEVSAKTGLHVDDLFHHMMVKMTTKNQRPQQRACCIL